MEVLPCVLGAAGFVVKTTTVVVIIEVIRRQCTKIFSKNKTESDIDVNNVHELINEIRKLHIQTTNSLERIYILEQNVLTNTKTIRLQTDHIKHRIVNEIRKIPEVNTDYITDEVCEEILRGWQKVHTVILQSSKDTRHLIWEYTCNIQNTPRTTRQPRGRGNRPGVQNQAAPRTGPWHDDEEVGDNDTYIDQCDNRLAYWQIENSMSPIEPDRTPDDSDIPELED